MNIVKYDEYVKAKQDFLKKHGENGWEVDTSVMDEYGQYNKTYICADEAQWIEHMRPVWVDHDIEVRGCKCKIVVKLLETEFYNSDDASSSFYYEKFNHEKEAEI